jgi:hypothetical protein
MRPPKLRIASKFFAVLAIVVPAIAAKAKGRNQVVILDPLVTEPPAPPPPPRGSPPLEVARGSAPLAPQP